MPYLDDVVKNNYSFSQFLTRISSRKFRKKSLLRRLILCAFQGLHEAGNCSRLENIVGDALQAATSDNLENAVTDRDLRVAKTYVTEKKNGDLLNVVMVVNLHTVRCYSFEWKSKNSNTRRRPCSTFLD
jgi:hypothetical protein